ncbi:hypothetical protein [Streptomyces sp. WAC05374]|nr:hypothetical protein [Streptomyces sp. WAC05374]
MTASSSPAGAAEAGGAPRAATVAASAVAMGSAVRRAVRVIMISPLVAA